MICLKWLAGFFDGEGCIGVIHCAKQEYFSFYVSISQKTQGILLAIQKELGGCLTQHELRWSGNAAFAVLEKIAPYLLVKKEQAEFTLANREAFIGESKRGRGYKLSLDTLQKRQEIRLQLAVMKPYSKILATQS